MHVSSGSALPSKPFSSESSEQGPTGLPRVVVPREEVPYILAHEKELSLVKSLLSPLAKQINPHLKAVNDAFWLGLDACKLYYNYEAWKLHCKLNQPNRNVNARFSDLAGHGLDVASVLARTRA